MRRFAVISVVLLFVGVFVAAWVSAQEGARRLPVRLGAGNRGELSPRQSQGVPRPLQVSDDAAPLTASTRAELIAMPAIDVAVQPAAGLDEPANGELQAGRRSISIGSRLGTAIVPAVPVAEARTIDGEVSTAGIDADTSGQAGPTLPSVLKRRNAPAATPAPTHEAPSAPTLASEVETSRGVSESSRRSITGSSRPLSVRSIQGSAPRATASAVPTAEALSEPHTVNNQATSVNPAQSHVGASQAHQAALQVHGQLPSLAVEAVGPQAVNIGKPATYQVRVRNESSTTAQDVEIRVGLPAWVQVQGGEGSRGDAKQEADASGRQWLVWMMHDLPGGSKEELALQLVAKQNQPFELAVTCEQKPTSAAGEISVREPQIEVRLEGPSDMLFGEQKTFTLHVSNPGTGEAEQVGVEVSSGGTPNRLDVGTLLPGQQKQIPFSVSAIAPGEMEIRAAATGAGGLTNEASSRVIVHKAELDVAVNVPPLSFAGTESVFEVTVSNIGDAVAEQVMLGIALPPGAKYVGGIDGAAAAGNGLALKLGNLAANSEKVFEVRCILTQAGQQRMEANVQGKGDLMATQVAATQVEALADLKLTVNEPRGPQSVGTESVYEVHLVNRGTKSAEKVKIVVQFGAGIEPVEAVGGTAALSNGQALFEPLAEIPAGKEVVLKVRTKTEQSGNHAFRVEVRSGEPETKLVSEGVTRCFTDAGATRATARKSNSQQPTPATKIR